MKILISGYGRMGRMIEKILLERGIEYAGWSEDVQSVDKSLAGECVCIDFTTPDAFRKNYVFLAQNFKAVVVGTTGWNDIKEEVISCFRENNTVMIHASNFSIGVNAFFAAVDYVSNLMGKFGGYSAYVSEKHHCHKLDRPSGTAKTIISLVEKNMGEVADVATVRCGEIPGIHTVGFESDKDRITLEHEAFSREGFAAGAVEAALMTEGLTGVHEFKELIFNK